MLAGVGGRTIEEAKQRISHDELMSWLDYRSKHGPLAMGERLEYALAQVSFYQASGAGMKKQGGGKLNIKDFLPYHKDEPLGIEQAMKGLGIKLGKKK